MRKSLWMLGGIMLWPLLAESAELSAACKPEFDALEKTLAADHTATTTRADGALRGVTLGGVVYVESRGAWRKMSITAKELIAQSRENLKDAKEFVCKPLPDSTIDGIPVANYSAHTVNDDTSVDSKVSIAKGNGLVVQVENVFNGDAPSRSVTRYGYTNVKAPM